MPNVNDLRDIISIWKYDLSDNEGGTPIEQFVFYRNKFANVKVRGGGTENNQLGNQPYTNTEFTIRYDKNITYQCEIHFENAVYKIQHIEVLGREDWMKLITVVFNQTFD